MEFSGRVRRHFPLCLWNRSSTTPSNDGAHKRFRVIHPFHPLHGQEFELIEYRNNWGEDRVCFEDAEGHVRSILANCTDAGGIDPFVEISRGRSWCRYEDLVRLADLLEAFRQCGVK